ncbi:MAG TPA: HEAT repeat domain-containing protein [Anaerolineales bacterium]|nr:HEAT repeat domain-containing protein [Anaerolineales bacterium]
MFTNIFGFQFDLPEFILGLILGVAASTLVTRAIPWANQALKWGQSQIGTISVGLPSGPIDRYRRELAAYVQGLHLARPLFGLQDVAIPPRILAPPMPVDPLHSEPRPEDTLGVLPNLPDWSHLSAIYQSPTLTLPEAMAHGANLMLTGELGSGKTTALAYIASRVAERDPAMGVLTELTPFLVHVANLRLDRRGRDPLDVMLGASQMTVSGGMASRLPAYMRLAFRQKRVLVLVDGLDEYPIEYIEPAAEWLESLQDAYPDVRIIASGPIRGYDGLTSRAGLAPALIAPWSDHDQRQWLTRWGAGWQQHVSPSLPKGRLGDLDPSLITGWMIGTARGALPLEFTLRTWAAYAGDARGGSIADAFEAYLSRVLSADERQSAEDSAFVWVNQGGGAIPERSLPRGTPVGDLVEAGLFVRRDGSQVSFAQPGMGAFLAAKAIARSGVPEAAFENDTGPGGAALLYFAAIGDGAPLVERWLQPGTDPLERNLVAAGRLLRHAPRKAAWRQAVLRSLAQLLQSAQKPYGLRLRAVHALVQSAESTAGILFRRLLASDESSTRILASLGLGGVRDEESVQTLIDVVRRDRDMLVRQAACLGLVGIGTEPAMEALGRALLEGEEGVRLAAAEALACNPDEGYNMLRDAVDVDNLLTRRAAVFGLARVPETWALELLDKVLVEDGQWVVRGAAAEAAERRRIPPWKVKSPVREPAELPWLVAFAARVGSGVAPGRPALEMLRRALSSGTAEEQLAALEALAFVGGDEFRMDIQQALKSDQAHLRDAAFEALWRLSAAGSGVPEPA